MSGWGCQSAPKHSQDFSWSFQGDSPKNTISHKLFITILHHQQKNPNHLTTKKLNFWRIILSPRTQNTSTKGITKERMPYTISHNLFIISLYRQQRIPLHIITTKIDISGEYTQPNNPKYCGYSPKHMP